MGFEWNDNAAEAAKQNNSQFEVLPAGKYRAVIADVQDKETKAGTGAYLNVELQIHGGSYDGRKVWEIINYRNPNDKAVEIGFRTLMSIGRALALPEKFNPNDMLDKMVLIETTIDSKGDQPRAKVKKWLPDGEAPVVSAAAANDSDVPF